MSVVLNMQVDVREDVLDRPRSFWRRQFLCILGGLLALQVEPFGAFFDQTLRRLGNGSVFVSLVDNPERRALLRVLVQCHIHVRIYPLYPRLSIIIRVQYVKWNAGILVHIPIHGKLNVFSLENDINGKCGRQEFSFIAACFPWFTRQSDFGYILCVPILTQKE